jgi:hypothetical protein
VHAERPIERLTDGMQPTRVKAGTPACHGLGKPASSQPLQSSRSPPMQDGHPSFSNPSSNPPDLLQGLLADLAAVHWPSSRPADTPHHHSAPPAQQHRHPSAGVAELDAFRLPEETQQDSGPAMSSPQAVVQLALMTVQFGKKNHLQNLATHPICRFICQRLQVSRPSSING